MEKTSLDELVEQCIKNGWLAKEMAPKVYDYLEKKLGYPLLDQDIAFGFYLLVRKLEKLIE